MAQVPFKEIFIELTGCAVKDAIPELAKNGGAEPKSSAVEARSTASISATVLTKES